MTQNFPSVILKGKFRYMKKKIKIKLHHHYTF